MNSVIGLQHEHTNLDNLEEYVHDLGQRPPGESCCSEASHLWHEKDCFLSLRVDDLAWYGVVSATRIALESPVNYGLLVSWFDNLDDPDRWFHDVSAPNSTLGRKNERYQLDAFDRVCHFARSVHTG